MRCRSKCPCANRVGDGSPLPDEIGQVVGGVLGDAANKVLGPRGQISLTITVQHDQELSPEVMDMLANRNQTAGENTSSSITQIGNEDGGAMESGATKATTSDGPKVGKVKRGVVTMLGGESELTPPFALGPEAPAFDRIEGSPNSIDTFAYFAKTLNSFDDMGGDVDKFINDFGGTFATQDGHVLTLDEMIDSGSRFGYSPTIATSEEFGYAIELANYGSSHEIYGPFYSAIRDAALISSENIGKTSTKSYIERSYGIGDITFDFGTSLTDISLFLADDYYKGSTISWSSSKGFRPKIYDNGWGGNRYRTTSNFSNVFKAGGQLVGGVVLAKDMYDMYNGNITPGEFSLNTGVAVAAMAVGGPAGLAIGAGWLAFEYVLPDQHQATVNWVDENIF